MDEWRDGAPTFTSYGCTPTVTIAFNAAAQRLAFLGYYTSDDARRAKHTDGEKRARA